LTGASELKPAGTTDSVNLPLIAKVVTREGAPVSGLQVSFEANVVAYSGGHEHHDKAVQLPISHPSQAAQTAMVKLL